MLFIQARLLLLWCYLPWTRCWRWCESTIKLNLCCLKLLYFPLLYSNLFILWTDGTLLRWIKKLSRFFWSYKRLNVKLFTFPLFQTKNILWPRCKRSIICPLCLHPPLFLPCMSWHCLPAHNWRQPMPVDFNCYVRQNLFTFLEISFLQGVSLGLWDEARQELVCIFFRDLREKIPGGMIFN